MSNATDALRDRVSIGAASRPALSKRTLLAPLSAVAFWIAIALPAVYLPLFVTGLDTPRGLLLFLGLFGVHLLALVAGRSHRRE